MRAALGLALAAGGVVLALMVLRGRTPFDATSASGGSASPSAPPNLAAMQAGSSEIVNRFGGTP